MRFPSLRLRFLVAIGVLALGVPLVALAGEAQPVADKASAASVKANVASCSACHGTDGGGQAASGIPRLFGLDAAYMKAQLVAFADGTRENAIMSPIAKSMDAAAMTDAAATYASLPAPAAAVSKPEPQDASGAALADRGDWSKNVPPCASCHGAAGRGVGVAFPGIAGQSASYIANQLKAWKAGTRHDDPLGLMRGVASRLSADQVAAVAAYYSALPAAAPKTEGGAK